MRIESDNIPKLNIKDLPKRGPININDIPELAGIAGIATGGVTGVTGVTGVAGVAGSSTWVTEVTECLAKNVTKRLLVLKDECSIKEFELNDNPINQDFKLIYKNKKYKYVETTFDIITGVEKIIFGSPMAGRYAC